MSRTRRYSRRAGWAFSVRLGLVYSVVFAIGLAAVFGGIYYWMATSLTQREVAATAERLREYRAWYDDGGLEALRSRFQEASRTSPEIMFLRATGPGGQAMLFAAPRGGEMIGPQDINRFRYDAQLVREQLDPQAPSENRWTIAAIRARDGVILQAGKSSREIEEVLASFRKTFAFTAIPAALVAIVVGTFFGFRRLAPVRRLIETMREILKTGDLERRAPSGEPSRNELNELGAMFNELLDRNSQLIGAMHQSLDAVAHDLRTPMTRLRNTAESAIVGNASPEAALSTCLEESDEALELLRALTEIAEADAGAIRLVREPVVVAELVERVLETYEFVAEEKSIALSSEISPSLTVKADRTRLSQVLANLVDNAVKFSAEGTQVAVSAGPTTGGVEIAITDSGPGIPEAERARIFDRLYRGEASRSTRGLGLGLSLVQAIVQAHGGTVLARERGDGEPGAVLAIVLPETREVA